MKAVYYEGDGRFSIGASEPRAPGPGEVRLDVAYCGVCGTDLHIVHGAMDHRVRTPQVIGHEMSGTVAALGDGVDGFEPGDAVVVRPLDCARRDAGGQGRQPHLPQPEVPRDRHARCVPAARGPCRRSRSTGCPPGLDLRLAALAEPLAVACHDVRRGEVCGRRDGRRDRRRPDRPAHRARRALAAGPASS